MTIHIVEDDLFGAATRALVALHHAGMHADSPPGTSYALDLSGLRAPGITVWTARDGDAVLGMVALKRLGAGRAELKSMRTHPDHLRRGVAARLLDHCITIARAEGLHRLSLETGHGPAFEPALTLYRSRGFANGELFGDYVENGANQFLHLAV